MAVKKTAETATEAAEKEKTVIIPPKREKTFLGQMAKPQRVKKAERKR